MALQSGDAYIRVHSRWCMQGEADGGGLPALEGTPLRTFEDPADGLTGVSVCLLDADAGVAAAACLGGHVALWDTVTGGLIAALPIADVEVGLPLSAQTHFHTLVFGIGSALRCGSEVCSMAADLSVAELRSSGY